MPPIPMLKVKNAWLMAPKITFPIPFSTMRLKSGTRKKRSPSEEPESVTERIVRMTMIARRQSMVTFMIFSTPFCRPMLQMPKDSRMTSTVQKDSVGTEESMPAYFSETSEAVTPVNSPFAMRKQ